MFTKISSSSIRRISRHPLVTGTILLTLAGLISRLIGFFYRIYLSRIFGEESMGIYQLISPVVSLAFSLCAAGYQTAVSKQVAEIAAQFASSRHPQAKRPLWAAISLSLPLSLVCTAFTFLLAQPIGTFLLKDSRTVPLLQIIAFSFPFVGVHACINGWFYGVKKAGLPALAQLAEQMTRVGCVYLITGKDLLAGRTPSISIAVAGLAVGEVISMLIAVLTFLPYCGKQHSSAPKPISVPYSGIYGGLISMVIPLTANRLVLNLLGSAESVAIPEMLKLYGYDVKTALSVYGVLTGMALPLIFFPNALTGSIAVMLLPMISENYCMQRYDAVKTLTLRTIKYGFFMGVCFLAVFVLFGPWLGTRLFHSSLCGRCIRTLGFICPILYLETTISSILQGLGKAGSLFLMNASSLLVRLCFVYLAVPLYGLKGYLWGMLVSQLFLSLLYSSCLFRTLKKHCHA